MRFRGYSLLTLLLLGSMFGGWNKRVWGGGCNNRGLVVISFLVRCDGHFCRS